MNGVRPLLRLTAAPFALALSFSNDANAQRACGDMVRDSTVARLLVALDRVAITPPVWDRYSLTNHPVVLIGDSTFRGSPPFTECVVAWRYGQQAVPLGLRSRLVLSTPFYGMLSVDSSSAKGPIARFTRTPDTASARVLRQGGISRAVVLRAPLELSALGAMGETLARAGADPVVIQAELAVHESFHLHVQMPTWERERRRRYAWPEWDVQPDRRAARERCYAGSPAIAAALTDELTALLASFDALLPGAGLPNRQAALRYAREFVTLRVKRRALQDTMTVARDSGRISCELAEDILEIEEGTAQWVGHATLVAAGVTTIAKHRASYGAPQPDVFYRTGPLQMWILRELLGADATRQFTDSLARSSAPTGAHGGLFARFNATIRELSSKEAHQGDADALVDRMLSMIGGRAAWAQLTGTVNDSQQNRPDEPTVVRSVITMDFTARRFRIETTAPNLRLIRVIDGERHWRLNRAGRIEPVPTETLREDLAWYNTHVYRTMHRLARRDSALTVRVGHDGRLEVMEGATRLAWFATDARGEPYAFGVHDDEVGSITGPWEFVASGIHHPIWVSRPDGKWRATLKSLVTNPTMSDGIFARPEPRR